MKNEDKQLLLKDLCARLPYGVILECCELVGEELRTMTKEGLINDDYDIDEVKPMLFPLSSMTKEQRKYIRDNYTFGATYELFDWFDQNHFDYRGLIEKGLAIEVTKENNPYKE